MAKTISAFAVLVGLSLAACGGKSAPTRNPGTGTSNLLVTADVDGAGSGTASSMLTTFDVRVKDGFGNNISGASVAISNFQLGAVQLVESPAGSGKYANSRAGFPDGDFQLSVLHPFGKVENVAVGGPGVHTINAPPAFSHVPANLPLSISWTTPTQANAASWSTRDFDGLTADTGAFVIPAVWNPPNNNQRLTISRYNEVSMAGGLPGSRLRVTVDTTVSPYFVP